MSRPGTARGATGLAPLPRPGTRSGPIAPMAPPVQFNPYGPPPSTGVRPPTGGIRPMTGMRTASGRPGTGMQGVAGGGIGMQTTMNLSARPVTQHGVQGMGTAGSQGPDRQLQDASYFLGILRSKCSELQTEISKIVANDEHLQKDTMFYGQLEKKTELLNAEVKTLQEKLADYNKTVEHQRTNVDLPEIKKQTAQLKSENAVKKSQLEVVFTERTAKERLVKDEQQLIDDIQRQAEQQINDLDPALRDDYFMLREKHSQLSVVLSQKQQELSDVDRQVTQQEMELHDDPLRQRVLTLQEQLASTKSKRDALAEDLQKKPLGGPEERAALLAAVKSDGAEITQMEQEMRENEETAARLREQLTQVEMDLQELGGGQSDKIMQVMEKDREMTAFMDTFDQARAQKMSELRDAQTIIVGLLEHISQGIQRQQHMPSREQYADMKSETEHKKQQTDMAAATLDKLGAELKERQSELERITSLDQKIPTEIADLEEAIQKMTNELPILVDLNSLREKCEAERKRLLVEKQKLIRHKDSLKQQVAVLSSKNERLKQSLQDSALGVELDSLEQKMRQYEQAVFILQEFIETKTRESNFKPTRDECLGIVAEVNNVLVRLAKMAPTTMA
eukprot:TRINITY_DN4108_c0_g1_i1.p2 TRINITY_DN4108_c0_g1~~TRINITY_DN4108_c0_g1_i1.p2  ORF type:complete len:622 (-),score=149.34 TRINITY_DN4108_c0_g1_i1:2087-3952(-)